MDVSKYIISSILYHPKNNLTIFKLGNPVKINLEPLISALNLFPLKPIKTLTENMGVLKGQNPGEIPIFRRISTILA